MTGGGVLCFRIGQWDPPCHLFSLPRYAVGSSVVVLTFGQLGKTWKILGDSLISVKLNTKNMFFYINTDFLWPVRGWTKASTRLFCQARKKNDISLAIRNTLYTRHLLYQAHLHQTPFTPDTFYTRHLLNQRPFTPDTFYTRHLLHQTPFTPGTLYTKQHRIHQAPFHETHFTPRTFYTRQLSQQTTFTPTTFYTCRILLHQPAFTTETFYTTQVAHLSYTFTPTSFYTRHLLHQPAFTRDTFYTNQLLH